MVIGLLGSGVSISTITFALTPSNEYTGAGAFAKLNVIYGVKFDIVLVKSLMQSKV